MFRYRTVIGVDFSDSYVAMALIRRKGIRVTVEETHRLPLTGDREADDRALVGFLSKKKWQGTPTVVGLRGESILLRILDVAPDDHRPVSDLLAEQMEHFALLDASETVYDHLVTRSADGGRRVLFAATRMDTVSRMMGRVQGLGLDVIDLMPSAVGLYNLSAFLVPRPAGQMICVDVEEDYTAVVIGENNEIMFMRRYLIGSRSMGFEEGDKGEKSSGKVDGSLKNWLSELKACLSFFQSRNPGKANSPTRLLMCGVPHWSQERLDWLRKQTGIDATVISEFGRGDLLSSKECCAVAAGLGLNGIGGSRVCASLIPREIGEALSLGWQWKYWAATGIMLVLSMAFYAMLLSRSVYNQRRSLADGADHLHLLQTLEQQVLGLHDEIEVLEERMAPLRTGVRNGEAVRAVIAAVCDVLEEKDWLYLIADSHTYFQDKSTAQSLRAERRLDPETAEDKAIRFIDQLIIEGFTPAEDLSSVRGMISRLRQYPFVKRVDLLPDDKIRRDEARDARASEMGGHLFALEIGISER